MLYGTSYCETFFHFTLPQISWYRYAYALTWYAAAARLGSPP